LSISSQIAKFRALDKWFKTTQGEFAGDSFSSEIQRYTRLIKGDVILQLGAAGTSSWLKLFNGADQWTVSPDKANKRVDLQASINQLPLDRNSVDIVVLPFAMEAVNDKSSLIDELDRILKPMGFVIILGLNPWGLWGLASMMGRFSCYGDMKPILHSPLSINRLFIQRGYRQCVLDGFCYLPPVKTKYWIKRLNILNVAGKMLWPFPSSLYCYIAQKYEPGYPPLALETARSKNNFNGAWEPLVNFTSSATKNPVTHEVNFKGRLDCDV